MSDEVDRANDTAEFMLGVLFNQRDSHREQAEQRISGGQVLCMDCEDEIGAARLAALPNAVRCIDCQSIHEQEKQKWA